MADQAHAPCAGVIILLIHAKIGLHHISSGTGDSLLQWDNGCILNKLDSGTAFWGRLKWRGQLL